jgi:hypothetical protein
MAINNFKRFLIKSIISIIYSLPIWKWSIRLRENIYGFYNHIDDKKRLKYKLVQKQSQNWQFKTIWDENRSILIEILNWKDGLQDYLLSVDIYACFIAILINFQSCER